jgi:hypothetical protein
MTECSMTAEEVFDSLTGFDEIAIAQQFRHTVADLAQNDVSMFARALVFVAKRRDGPHRRRGQDRGVHHVAEGDQLLLRRGRSRRGVGKRRAARGVARNLAEFCLLTGRSKEEYLLLTRLEREEFIDAAKDARAEPGASKVMSGADATAWMAAQGGG